MAVVKKTWKQVDGVLLLDKPIGLTSNDALQKARRLFSAAKGGHTGTLDPLATGLLPLCFGEATKFSADLLDADKVYETTLKLGITTDTGDAEGEVIGTAAVNVADSDVLPVLQRFLGDILQVPPMHSALKRDGKPLYELARQGVVVERQPRPVTIHSIELLEFSGDQLSLRVHCSKGTYIRVLGEEIGNALGCGAHLISLRRTQVGALTLAGAVSLEALQVIEDDATRLALLKPVDALVSTLPSHSINVSEESRFSHGNPVEAPAGHVGKIRVYAERRLLGVGEVMPDGKLWPKRLVQLKLNPL